MIDVGGVLKGLVKGLTWVGSAGKGAKGRLLELVTLLGGVEVEWDGAYAPTVKGGDEVGSLPPPAGPEAGC